MHLMIERPERHVAEFVKAGADSITIHVEATPHVHYTLATIREGGCGAGAAICPATPASSLDEVAAETLDLALCMSVNPGWGGQKFIAGSLDKLERMRARLKACPAQVPLMEAIRVALIDFNQVAPAQVPLHRRRSRPKRSGGRMAHPWRSPVSKGVRGPCGTPFYVGATLVASAGSQ